MRTLVFADLHLKPFPEELIATIAPDETIFLGDYFDQYHDTPLKAQITAMQLQDSLKNSNRIHLRGNHDLHYIYSGHRFLCPGYTEEKFEAINSIMNPSDWHKLKWFHISQGFLFTHAGVHPLFLHTPKPDMDYMNDFMYKEAGKAHWSACQNKKHWFFWRGPDRGGMDIAGGTMWLGWHDPSDESSFQAIKGLNQVVGHSCHTDPQFLNTKNSININLDTGFNHYLLITDGVPEVHVIDQARYEATKKAWLERKLKKP